MNLETGVITLWGYFNWVVFVLQHFLFITEHLAAAVAAIVELAICLEDEI